MKYYGYIVSELDGFIENLEGEFNYKPSHEICGFAFAKWFTNIEDRDKSKEYIISEIKNIKRKTMNPEIKELIKEIIQRLGNSDLT